MALDRSKLHKGFQTYLANAETASGKTYDDMSLVLSNSGLKKHGELRSHLMDQMGLGHGHANAVVAIWLQQDAPVKGPVKKAAKKAPAKKPAAKKALPKKAAPNKTANKKTAKKK
jgi:hypothetical protein